MGKKRKRRKQVRPEGWGVRPQQVEAWLDRAETQLMNGAYSSVVQTTRLILRHVPQGSKPYAEANYLLGAALGMLEDFEGSREAYSRTLEADPQNASAWYNRALSHRFLLRTGEALHDVERAIELEERPRQREVYGEERALLRPIVEKQLAMRGPDYTVDQLIEDQRAFSRGVQLMAAAAWEEAESVFRRLTASGDVPHQAWGNLGACLVMQERYDEAEEALRKALEIHPGYGLARRNLAMLPLLRETGPPDQMRIDEPWRGRKLRQSMEFFWQEES